VMPGVADCYWPPATYNLPHATCNLPLATPGNVYTGWRIDQDEYALFALP
jgi:hypothetical protein